MNELQRLIRERALLDAKIAALRHAEVECGRAMLSYDPFTGRWRVMFVPIVLDSDYQVKDQRRASVAFGSNKERLIEEIPMVIADLQGLYDNCKGILKGILEYEDESEKDPQD